ncbi:endonuclease Q family protein [Lysinibacillus sp. KU-BSD001]|uniref:endonuclease Q family protein n=1 Tax=Lysinibacillus sp. KU-BSD001 TaxID=3141328 RepID=UPI0036E88293
MKAIYADLHIHIGRTASGKPVKITGSKTLTLQNILEIASNRKGLDMIGIIDCHSPEVLLEIEAFIQRGDMIELADGGLRFQNTTLIMGSEMEVYDQYCHGPIHVLAYFPTVEKMKSFSQWMDKHVKNSTLSSQRIYVEGRALQKQVYEHEGLFVPAHVFTPFKSLYGKGVQRSLTEVFDPTYIDAIELGLSSDTYMVSKIKELQAYPFLTNSDAHSLEKMAREYQKLQLKEANFEELKKALRQEEGRAIGANYGLNPLLGKYYQTVCAKCGEQLAGIDKCPQCGNETMITGVSTRIEQLSDPYVDAISRPPYIHQVPLDFIPGLGPKTLDRLLQAFSTEMAILHDITKAQLEEVVPEKLASLIERARKGELSIVHGGGGKYGKIIDGHTTHS